MRLFYKFNFKVMEVCFFTLFFLLSPASLLAGDSSSLDQINMEVRNQSPGERIYKIAVLAYKGKAAAIKRWAAHEAYLNQQLAPLKFEIIPLTYKADELTQAVINRQVDFVITNPGHYIELEFGGHVSRLATRRMASPQGILDQFGGTAIVKAERNDINSYADLSGKNILIPSQSSLGGWQVHLREAMALGIDLRDDAQLIELKSHRKVVTSILAGVADAGFIRSDLIEELVGEGMLTFDKIKVIDKKQLSDYPYLLSTRLYPEWPFAVVTGTSPELAVKVLASLLQLSADDTAAKTAKIYGWTIPGHYSTVGDLFRETGLGPYKIQAITLRLIATQYWLEIIGIMLFFLVLLLSILRTVKTNRVLRLEIDTRKQVEEELRKSESNFRNLFENAEISIRNEDMSELYDSLQQLRVEGVTDLRQYLEMNSHFVTDTVGKIKVTHVNKATLKLFDSKVEHEFLSNIEHSFGENAQQVFVEEICAIWDKESTFCSEANYRTLNGRDINAVISFRIPETREDFKRVPVCIFDISAARQSEKKLEKSEQNLTLAQQISHLGSWELNFANQQLSWSDEIFRIFEIDPELFEPSYQAFVECIHPEDREFVDKAYKDSVDNKTLYDIEHRLLMKDGRVKYVNERCETTYTEKGEPLNSVGIILDISERKLIHQELEQRIQELSQARIAALNMMQDVETSRQEAEQASRAKSEFLTNMSHEIRTPLNAVTGMSYLLKQTRLTDKQAEYIDTIHRSMMHVTGIINDLLDFSKIEAGKLELESIPFDLDMVIDSLTDFIIQEADRKGVELLYKIPLNVPRALIGDPTRLGQVLINLAGNAVKFCDQGEVVVSISVAQSQKDSVTLAFSIKDSGIGMDKTQVSHLFEAFRQADNSTTRRFGGTGLGLAISKYLVQAMKGEIEIQSKLDIGSEFLFTVRFGVQTQEKFKSFAVPADLRQLNVLIVDDNSISREILGSILRELSFDYATASSGREAIELLTTSEKHYDLILLDWLMPEMNGIETARHITHKLKLPNSPLIIMVSAYEKERVMAQAEDAGLHGYLHKPVNASILYDAIMMAMGKVLPKAHWRKTISEQTRMARIDAAGRRILLVEDQPVNRQIATEILIRNGFVVESVENGKLAVKLIKQDLSAFDAILMDIQMPVMDGYEATRLIREMADKDKLPIIAMTAHALEEERQKCGEAGMNAHISKPVDVVLMLAELSKCLGISASAVTQSIESLVESLPEQVPGIALNEGLQRVIGNYKLYSKLLSDFPAQYDLVLHVIQDDIKAGQYEEAVKAVHTLAGSAGNLSMKPLRTACKSLQRGLELGHVDNNALKQVEQMFEQVVESIASLELATIETSVTKELMSNNMEQFDSDALVLLLQELESLLENNDMRAQKKFEHINGLIERNDDFDDLKTMGELIAHLDYTQALIKLRGFVNKGV